MRHRNNFAGPKAKEDNQHIKIIPRVKRRGQNIIIARPKFVMVAVCPVHYDESTDDTGGVPGADVAPKIGQRAKEDGTVPEVKFGAWKAPMEKI